MHKYAHEAYNKVYWQSQIIDTRPSADFYRKGTFGNKRENHMIGSVNMPFDQLVEPETLQMKPLKQVSDMMT